MFVRIRWFLIRVACTLGVGIYLAGRARTMGDVFTARSAANAGARSAAGLLESAAQRIAPSRN